MAFTCLISHASCLFPRRPVGTTLVSLKPITRHRLPRSFEGAEDCTTVFNNAELAGGMRSVKAILRGFVYEQGMLSKCRVLVHATRICYTFLLPSSESGGHDFESYPPRQN
ncbi:hypothetical protein, variant [Cryptococcus amylolentus CBS 6039]|uniref:Uncharacterized protein n=1 Tax=Cryptococcus amylolentus CBS 6039 TaxID=1295533 RepID=A0A1E3HGK7_9TREE|nr:hypothetical protein L202_07178 [Cryptococcus amylolentus CBS 6039]XP_018990657.1 hypothetical protein, variant [Cryptococcus amylolentus CBS 6039]ODN74875.1 hypothetical protein L202_07178 [Cryptococcus amylolentus CBS 6039]ODN74876.1 hypothetical protein, variant [Cryptococcus amylolentus CBS 6039]